MAMNRYLKRTALIQAGLVGILAGILLARFGWSTNVTFMAAGFALTPLVARLKWLAIVAAIAIGLNIGLWRGSAVWQQLSRYRPFQDQSITLLGTVTNDAAYSQRGQLEFQIKDITAIEGNTKLPGTVRVRAFNVMSVRRGDVVEASGKLRQGFGSRQGFMSFAQVDVIARDNSTLERIRSEYFSGVYSALPEPQASLGLGFLVGTRTLLPEALTVMLSVTGLTHIVAVSGYNLTILVRLTRRMLAKRSIYLATVASIGLITGFVLVTGLSPSIARATVVSGLAITCWYFGRTIRPAIILLAAAALTALINPLYLWFDLGWYLSFTAFIGVLILAPLIQKRYFKQKPKIVGQIMLETTSAQLLTLPIIAVIFSEVSLISLLANVIVLPLIPLAMLTTFIAGLAGMLVPAYAGWLAWPATLVLSFMTEVIEILAKIPWALQQIDMSWLQLATLYASLAALMLVMRTKLKQRLDGVEVIE